MAGKSERAIVTIDGIELPPELVLYAGVTGGIAGMNQLSIRIPSNLSDGDHEVNLRLGNASTPRGGFITIRR